MGPPVGATLSASTDLPRQPSRGQRRCSWAPLRRLAELRRRFRMRGSQEHPVSGWAGRAPAAAGQPSPGQHREQRRRHPGWIPAWPWRRTARGSATSWSCWSGTRWGRRGGTGAGGSAAGHGSLRRAFGGNAGRKDCSLQLRCSGTSADICRTLPRLRGEKVKKWIPCEASLSPAQLGGICRVAALLLLRVWKPGSTTDSGVAFFFFFLHEPTAIILNLETKCGK